MNNKLTTKLMEALQAAQQSAQANGRAVIEPEELMLALLEQEGGILSPILQKAGSQLTELKVALKQQLKRIPAQSGAALSNTALSPALNQALAEADRKRCPRA